MGNVRATYRKEDTSLMYTEAAAAAWKSIRKPWPFTLDVVQHSHSLSLRIYESEFKNLTGAQYADATDYLNEVKHTLEASGEIVFIEGVKGVPPRR